MKKNTKKLMAAGLLCAIALTLTACGTKTDEPKAANAATPASGKVTVYMPSPAGLSNKIAKGFEKKTGIKVEQFQGTTGEILARLEAEKSNPAADVVILASWSDGLSMKQKGELAAY